MYFSDYCYNNGLPEEELASLETPEDLLSLMEKKCLLHPDFLAQLQYMLFSLDKKRALRIVDEYAECRKTQPIRLFKCNRKGESLY